MEENSSEFQGIFFTIGNESVNIQISPELLNKKACKILANHLLNYGYIHKMSIQQIAEEIYTHAVFYYWYKPDGIFLRKTKLSKFLYSHCEDGALVQSGGDTKPRRIFYRMTWRIFDGKTLY